MSSRIDIRLHFETLPPGPKTGPPNNTTHRLIIAIALYNSDHELTNMESRTQRTNLLLSNLSADLILKAKEHLHDLIQRAEQILDDLELALDISAFSQHQYTLSKGCSTSQSHDRTSIFKTSSGQHPELRRCQKYAELRDASQSLVETQRLEMQYVKPRAVYIRRPTTSNSSQ